MVKFTDTTIFTTENPTIKPKIDEENLDRKKYRLTYAYAEKFRLGLIDITIRFLKYLICQNYHKEKEFFNQVKNIQEKNEIFFEKLLELNIPDRYNKILFTQLLMLKTEDFQTDIGYNKNCKFYLLTVNYPLCLINKNVTLDYYLRAFYNIKTWFGENVKYKDGEFPTVESILKLSKDDFGIDFEYNDEEEDLDDILSYLLN